MWRKSEFPSGSPQLGLSSQVAGNLGSYSESDHSSFSHAKKAQVIAINELLALGFANLGGALYGAVPTQILGNRTYEVCILAFGYSVLVL